MSNEYPKTAHVAENPKHSEKFLAEKKLVLEKLAKAKVSGIDAESDTEFFTLNTKDKDGKPYQVKFQVGMFEFPVKKDPSSDEISHFPIEDVIEAQARFADKYSLENPPSTYELLQLLYAAREKERAAFEKNQS